MQRDNEKWQAITALYKLLIYEKSNIEADYQNFFENHPISFLSLGIDKAISFEKQSKNKLPLDKDRGFTPEPDFLGANIHASILSIIELKTPFIGKTSTSRSDGNRPKFKSKFDSYVSQSNDYLESIREHEEARSTIVKKLNITRIMDYQIILIAGLASENDRAVVTGICSRQKESTEIIFYDDLLHSMIDEYSSGRDDAEPRDGLCISFGICIAPQQSHKRAWIGSIGEDDNLYIYIDDKAIHFACNTIDGTSHSLSASIQFAKWHYVRFEVANDSNGIYMSLNLDNVEQDLRVGNPKFAFNPQVSQFTFGADSAGARGAHFAVTSLWIIGTTLGTVGRIVSYLSFEKEHRESAGMILFTEESFVRMMPGGYFTQENESYQSKYYFRNSIPWARLDPPVSEHGSGDPNS